MQHTSLVNHYKKIKEKRVLQSQLYTALMAQGD